MSLSSSSSARAQFFLFFLFVPFILVFFYVPRFGAQRQDGAQGDAGIVTKKENVMMAMPHWPTTEEEAKRVEEEEEEAEEVRK